MEQPLLLLKLGVVHDSIPFLPEYALQRLAWVAIATLASIW
jgi:hypothetical protein